VLIDEPILTEYFGDLGYAAPFLFLVGAGGGLPVPEEVTMVASGYLLFRAKVSFFPIVLTCWVATLLGDSIPYWVGHHFGKRALKWRWVAKMIHPERIALIEERVQQHGNWAIFTCRFLPGVRMPAFFTAGTVGMHYGRFILFDALAACVMVPMYILLGRGFGENIAWLETQIEDSSEYLGLALLVVLVTVGVRILVHRREKQVASLGQAGSGAPGTADPADPEKPEIPGDSA